MEGGGMMDPIEGVSVTSAAEVAQYEARMEAEAAMLRRLIASEAAAVLQLVASIAPMPPVAPVSPGRGGALDTYAG